MTAFITEPRFRSSGAIAFDFRQRLFTLLHLFAENGDHFVIPKVCVTCIDFSLPDPGARHANDGECDLPLFFCFHGLFHIGHERLF